MPMKKKLWSNWETIKCPAPPCPHTGKGLQEAQSSQSLHLAARPSEVSSEKSLSSHFLSDDRLVPTILSGQGGNVHLRCYDMQTSEFRVSLVYTPCLQNQRTSSVLPPHPALLYGDTKHEVINNPIHIVPETEQRGVFPPDTCTTGATTSLKLNFTSQSRPSVRLWNTWLNYWRAHGIWRWK